MSDAERSHTKLKRSAPRMTAMRKRRLAVNLSQAEVAARSGLSLAWISEVERQPTFLTPSVAEKIAAALGCTEKDILP